MDKVIIKEAGTEDREDKPSTWTVSAELTVFAGDMDKESVIAEAERLLEDITDGTDFVSFSVIDAKRDEF